MRDILGPTDLESLAGEELGVSSWHTIDQAQIQAFADATGDQQWIHTDQDLAATGPYGTTVAHGYLTLSLIPFFAKQVYQVSGTKMNVNYGLNKVRFPGAVPAGARIRDRITVLSVRATGGGAQAVFRHEIEVEGKDKPGCVAEAVTLFVAQAT